MSRTMKESASSNASWDTSLDPSTSMESHDIAQSLTQEQTSDDSFDGSSDEEQYVMPRLRSRPGAQVRSILKKRPSMPGTPMRNVTFSSSTAHPITPPSPPSVYGSLKGKSAAALFYQFEHTKDAAQKIIISDSPPAPSIASREENPLHPRIHVADAFNFTSQPDISTENSIDNSIIIKGAQVQVLDSSQSSFTFEDKPSLVNVPNMLQASLPPSYDASGMGMSLHESTASRATSKLDESLDQPNAVFHQHLSITPMRSLPVQFSTTPKVSPPRFDFEKASTTPDTSAEGEEEEETEKTLVKTPAMPRMTVEDESLLSLQYSPCPKPVEPASVPLPDTPLQLPSPVRETEVQMTPMPVRKSLRRKSSLPAISSTISSQSSPESVYYSPQSLPRSASKRRLFSSKSPVSSINSPPPSEDAAQVASIASDKALSPRSPIHANLSDLQQALYDNQAEIINHSEAHKDLLMQMLKSLQEELRSRDAELTMVKKQRDVARSGWDSAIEDAGSWEDERDSVERERLSALQEELRERDERIAVMSLRLQQVESGTQDDTRAHQESQLEAQEQITSLQQQLGDLRNKNANLGKELLESQSQIEHLTDEVSQQVDMLDQANQHDIEMQNVIQEADKDNEDLRNLVDNLQEQLQEARLELDRVQDATTLNLDVISGHQSRIVNLEGGQDRLLASIAELEAALTVKDTKIQQMQEKMKATNREECQHCATSLKGTQDLRNKCETLQKTVNIMKLESADREVKIARLIKSKAELKEDHEQLTIALDAKQLEIGMLKRRNQPRESLATSTNVQLEKPVTKRPSTAPTFDLPNHTMETPLPRSFTFSRKDQQQQSIRPRRISFGKSGSETPMPLQRLPSSMQTEDEKENRPIVTNRRKMAVLM